MTATRRPAVLARRLVVVTGKGGVGKSTVAAALGVAAARRGLRTVVVEVAARRDVPVLLGVRAGDGTREVELEPRLHHVSVDPREAMAEYLRHEVPGLLPGAVLSRSRVFELFTQATPGMRELLSIGKVWELAQRPRRRRGALSYDLVVLDAPASGHAVAMLGAPRTFGTVARVGPIAHQGGAIAAMLADRHATAVVAVAAPEQMAVTEVLGLPDALAGVGVALDGVVVNRVFPRRFSSADTAALATVPDDPAVRSARWMYERARVQRAHLGRLRRGLDGTPSTTLPFLFPGEIARPQVARLADVLGRWAG